jgi:plasmid stabilization system protein ParE
MIVEYSRRAAADLHEIAAGSRRVFGDRVAAGLELRIREIVEQIAGSPESAPWVADRPGIHVVPSFAILSRSSIGVFLIEFEFSISGTHPENLGD